MKKAITSAPRTQDTQPDEHLLPPPSPGESSSSGRKPGTPARWAAEPSSPAAPVDREEPTLARSRWRRWSGGSGIQTHHHAFQDPLRQPLGSEGVTLPLLRPLGSLSLVEPFVDLQLEAFRYGGLLRRRPPQVLGALQNLPVQLQGTELKPLPETKGHSLLGPGRRGGADSSPGGLKSVSVVNMAAIALTCGACPALRPPAPRCSSRWSAGSSGGSSGGACEAA